MEALRPESIPELRNLRSFPSVDLENLKKAIMKLPKDLRVRLEKFCGLTGGINRIKMLPPPISSNLAVENMRQDTIQAIKMLFTIEYASIWMPHTVQWIVRRIKENVEHNGRTEFSDNEIAQLLMVYWVIIRRGPEIREDESSIGRMLDHATLNESMVLIEIIEWIDSNRGRKFQLEAILLFIDMMNLEDSTVLRNKFRIGQYEKTNGFRNFAEIRAFKERLFQTSAWLTFNNIVEGKKASIDKETVEELWKLFRIRSFDERIKYAWKGRTERCRMKMVPVYEVGKLKSMDMAEIELCYIYYTHFMP